MSNRDCVQIETATLRWVIGGLISALVGIAVLIYGMGMNYQRQSQQDEKVNRMLNMHHTAIGQIAEGCCPPLVRQSVTDIFFRSVQAGEQSK